MHFHASAMSRARRISGNALLTFPGLVLVASSFTKLAHVPAVVGPLARIGFYGDRLLFIAILEIGSALLFLLPRTRSLGLLLVSSYLGGAIAAHVGHGESIVPPALILALAWIGAAVRDPQTFWSFAQRAAGGAVVSDQRMAA
jgi:DoxX-like protein